ncbi:MAG: two-component system response regulator [Chlorobiaceae bacterium]|nr:two-component system response regulator [Chlorobiaceae bacterium]
MEAKPKILFVDDDSSLKRILEKILQDEGYNVDVASDGNTAKEKLLLHDYDVAILDNNLPGMNAIDVLKEINHPDVTEKVIMITAVNEDELAREGKKLGVREFLAKPFDMDKVISSIQRIHSLK